MNNIILQPNNGLLTNENIKMNVAFGTIGQYRPINYTLANIMSPSIYNLTPSPTTYYPPTYSPTYINFTNLNKKIIAYNGGGWTVGATGGGRYGYNSTSSSTSIGGYSSVIILDSSYNIVGTTFSGVGTQGYLSGGIEGCGGGAGGPGSTGGIGIQFNLYGMNKSIYWGGGGGGRGQFGGKGGSGGKSGPDTNSIVTAISPAYAGTGSYGSDGVMNSGGGGGYSLSGQSSNGGSGIVILSFEHKTGFVVTPINATNIFNTNIIYVNTNSPNFLNGYFVTSASTTLSSYTTTDPFLLSPSQSNGWSSYNVYNSSGTYTGTIQTLSSTYKGEWLQIQLQEY
jgi:hypothetical protein